MPVVNALCENNHYIPLALSIKENHHLYPCTYLITFSTEFELKKKNPFYPPLFINLFI